MSCFVNQKVMNEICWITTQAVISLQAAAARFAPGRGDQVAIKSACEIDKACQHVLKATYGTEQCIFADITKVDMKKETCYCERHQKMCELQPRSEDPNCTSALDSLGKHMAFKVSVFQNHLNVKSQKVLWFKRDWAC